MTGVQKAAGASAKGCNAPDRKSTGGSRGNTVVLTVKSTGIKKRLLVGLRIRRRPRSDQDTTIQTLL